MTDGALSLHLGPLCGALTDHGPRYLPCANRNDPAITADEPEVLSAGAGSEETPVTSGSRTALFDPNMQERKDEIDALRARVDVILNKMVQNSGDDVTRLRQKIADLRTGPPEAAAVPPGSIVPRQAAITTTPWNPSDPKNCPLSPMTTNTAITNATQNTTATNNTQNSATPSADTEQHANLSKKQPVTKKLEPPLLTTPPGSHKSSPSHLLANTRAIIHTPIPDADEERDDDDEEIDDMEFDFKVAPLSLSKSKSAQMPEMIASNSEPKKESKDPPASLKASESLLPDPGGDDSYCSGEVSRAESPPPGSVLYEAAARKADAVVEREREEKEQLEREQLQQQLAKTKQLLQQQQEQLMKQNLQKKQAILSLEHADNMSRTSKTTHKSAKTCPVPEMVSPRAGGSVSSRPTSVANPRARPMVQSRTHPAPIVQHQLVQPQSPPQPEVVRTAPPSQRQRQLQPEPQRQAQPQPQPQPQTKPVLQSEPEPVVIIDADAEPEESPMPPAVVQNPVTPQSIPRVVETTAVNTAMIHTEPQAIINTEPQPVINTEPQPVTNTEPQPAINKKFIGTNSANADPPATPVGQRQPVEAPQRFDRSKSPPPPVANVNIPNIVVKPTNQNPGTSVAGGSHSDSSLTRPPSPSPVGEITMVEEVSEQRIRDPYGDKGLYTGVLVKRRPHGRGTMKYDDGRHYEGHWNHGRWHGVGRAIFANNDIFEGSYDMDQRHGHGMYQWNDGRVYTGQFFQDQRQGRGTYTWPDGAVYQGEFKAGHRHGQGMYRFADGSVYTGEWENGKYHGVGECRWSDGRSYRGEWKEGRANGYGVETRPNGTIRHDGEWKDDRPIRDSKRNAQNAAK